MKITAQQTKIEEIQTPALVIGYWQDQLNEDIEKLDKQLNNSIKQAIKNKEFTGELYQIKIISTLGKSFQHLLLIGLGKQTEFNPEKLRNSAATAALAIKNNNFKQYATNLHTIKFTASTEQKTAAVVEASILALHHFTDYKTTDRDKIHIVESMTLIETKNPALVEKTINTATTIAQATCFARDMVNHPASHMTPLTLADIAKKLPKQINVTVHNKKSIEKMKMHAILAVNKGSSIEPRLIVLKYNNGRGQPIALVGKGVTFDSGGLNIKPESSMETMKMDMAGAAAVLGTFKAAAELGLKVNLLGVLPCTENMINGSAYKPGDIITAYNGKTIEIANTDAEGRVILADALAYAEELKPRTIIDLATLTGACIVALGHEYAGIMGTDEKLITELINAGQQTGEKIWQLPLTDEFREQVKSDIADVRNLGKLGRDGGAITGAAFLNNFINNTPWIHIDIAGTAWALEDKHYLRKGATGYGVRLLINFLQNTTR